jgi:hypothetical protein
LDEHRIMTIATLRFEWREHLPKWDLHANDLDVEIDEESYQPEAEPSEQFWPAAVMDSVRRFV